MKGLAVIGALFVLALPAYLAGVGRNPPGYFVDEAAISYNAWCIETHGADEFDIPYPLFFKSGGDYKNPVYIYLLALMFKIFGPSVGLARGQSAVLGDLGAAAFAWLAWTMSGRRWIAVATFLLAFATAAYWEVAHLVFEVSAYPLVLALFAIALWYARERWRFVNVLAVGVMLALVTYTYTSGRLIGPLLALGLVFFLRRDRVRPIIATWAVYAILGPIPMAIFHFTNDHALTARYRIVRSPTDTPLQLVEKFAENLARNADPIGETLMGDFQERHHVPHSGGNVLGATFILAVAGAFVALRRRDPWDKFVIYALFASLIPVSLTFGSMHILRAMPYFAFLTVLSIEGMMAARRPLLAIAFVLAIVQAAWFFHVWTRDSGRRATVFDCCVPPVLDVALAQHRFPIYLHEMIVPEALWFATLRGVDRSHFVIDREPPPGAIAITNKLPCAGCRVLAHDQLFYTYVAR